MTMESDLTTLLKGLCTRTYPDVAPSTVALPYVTYQHIGGQPLRFVDGVASDKRHTLLQINVWAATRAGALDLMRQIEDAMCAASAFVARPESEPIGDHEAGTLERYGCLQDYSIWAAR